MNLVLNILWLIFGGIEAAFFWFMACIILAITIIGIPWAKAAFNLGLFVLWPFGRTVVARDTLTGQEDIGTGALGFIGNVIWFVLAGIWLAIAHVFLGVLLCITLIGIPFGIQHFKFAGLAFAPIGKTIVDKEIVSATQR